jgi:glycosyltransferase involved in cell wall biosynthesis
VKILLISPTQSGIGGIAQHVQGLTKFLQNEGHEVEIISSENTFTIPIKGLKNPSFMISSFFKSKFKKNFDIVHAHNIPSALAMKNSSGKKILTIHGIFSKQIGQIHNKSAENISGKYEINALSWADAISTISKDSFEYYSNLSNNVSQISNGINLSDFNQESDRRFDKQIIFAGRLSKEKGIETLLQICNNLDDNLDLLIIGTGPEQEKFTSVNLKKKNIHYLGFQNHKKTISLIKGSDILIQPSLSEGISTTLLEAMACKTCIITSNVGGNLELIKNQENGILIDPTDDELFIKTIHKLFKDELLRKKFSETAFDRVKEYDWKNIGKKYLDLYESLL